MKLKMASLLELAIPLSIVLFLSGCFGDSGGSPTYDGTWTVAYTDSAFTPPPASGVTGVVCTVQSPLPSVSIVNGAGSTSQTNTCLNTSAGTQQFIYLISVAVNNSNGAVNAVVNGSSLTGQCVSSVGCAAQSQSGRQTLSITR